MTAIPLATAPPETPADWLLAKYDRQARDPLRIPGTYERPMFELLVDHHEYNLTPATCGICTPIYGRTPAE